MRRGLPERMSTLVVAAAMALTAGCGGGASRPNSAANGQGGAKAAACTKGGAAKGPTLTVPAEPNSGVDRPTAACWAGIAATKETQVDAGKVPAGASAVFKTAWSKKDLYVWVYAARWPLHDAGSAPFENDATEFDISGTNDHAGAFGSHTFHAAVVEGAQKVAAIQGHAASPLVAITKVVQGKGYDAELIVPWSAVGVSAPAKGQKYQFDMGQDFGNSKGARLAQIFWAGAPGSQPDWSHDTLNWGVITLG